MERIEREKEVIRQMIQIYCSRKHHPLHKTLCDDCNELLKYALQRLDKCPKRNAKSSCRKCEIHCYAPIYKVRIRTVMRFVGPRMIFMHPLAAIRHFFE